jgi:hypothetical protein
VDVFSIFEQLIPQLIPANPALVGRVFFWEILPVFMGIFIFGEAQGAVLTFHCAKILHRKRRSQYVAKTLYHSDFRTTDAALSL